MAYARVVVHDDDTAHDAVRDSAALTMSELAARAGLTVEQVDEVRRASGLEPVAADAAIYVPDDVAAFRLLQDSAAFFGWDDTIAFVRVVGSSLNRVADAAVDMFHASIAVPMISSGAAEEEVVARQDEAQSLADELTHVTRLMLRLHLEQSTERRRRAQPEATVETTLPLAVGFFDIVGFTSHSSTMSTHELTELVSRFETIAQDTITNLRGRMVKFIGDEVMFVAVDPADGCRIAAALLDRFVAEPGLTPRGGLAHGPVLTRGGDFFGSTVNVAARLVDQSVPREVLMTEAMAQVSPYALAPAGYRQLKGFDEPIRVVSLMRGAGQRAADA